MKRLYLKWKDVKNQIYTIATLYRNEGYYYLMINNEEMTNAIKNGCSGIGELDINVPGYKSEELFRFFKNRILPKDSEYIEEVLKEYGLTEYDEMELLKKTNGYSGIDRYYLEEE